MKKRVISCFLCLCMLIGLFGAVPFARAESYSGTAGTLSWSFDTETGTMTFSGSGTVSSGQWNMYRGQIRSIVINEGITGIPSGVFGGISTVTEISIPSTVETIGSNAFGGCSNLTDIQIPDGVKSIGGSAFSGCSSLTAITVPDSVESIGNALFVSCTGLTTVTLGEGITVIGDLTFGGCANLTTVNVEGTITAIGDSAFAGCSKLSAAPLDEGLVTIGSSAFNGCSSLTELTIPSTVESIGIAAFGGCTAVPAFNVAADNTHYCNDASGVLYNIDKTVLIACPIPFAGSYKLPSSVKTIENSAFAGCENLTAVKLNSGLETIGDNAFRNSSVLAEMEIPNSVRSIGSYAFADCIAMESAKLPNSVTYMGTNVFQNCSMLESVNIPAGITALPMMTFYGCSALEEITVPEGITQLDTSVFANCGSLKSVTLPDSLVTIGNSAFSGCSALADIHIPENVNSISSNAFNGCIGMTAITVAAESETYCAEDGVLFNKDKTTLILFPKARAGAFVIPEGVTALGYGAFKECGKVTEISIPEGITSIGGDCFYRCVLLERVNIPDSVTAMPTFAFEYCTGLLEVKVGSGITTISRGAFRGCANLTAISLPAGITTVSAYAFNDCNSLDHILFEGTQEQWNAIKVEANNSGLSDDATVHFEATGEEIYWDEYEGRQQLHCAVCESVVETPCNHFNTEIRNAADASCSQEGYTGDVCCVDCGKLLEEGAMIPADPHTVNAYEDNGDGTHNCICSVCGATEYENEGHFFVDGSCICGAVEITEPVVDGKISIGETLSLESDLTMNFRIKTEQLAEYDLSTAYLVVERDVYNSNGTMEVETRTLTDYTIKDNRLVFAYTGISAAQMNDEIRAVLHIQDADGKEYKSNQKVTSVAIYSDLMLGASAGNEKLITLIMDMLNYGTAAQIYFNRHADAPVNEAFESFKTYADYASADLKTALEDMSGTISNGNSSATITQGLDLSTRVGITYKVKLPAGVDAASASLIVKDANGNELEIFDLSTGTVDSKGRYCVTFFGSNSREMRRVVYATVMVDGEAISDTYSYTISSYAHTVANSAGMPEALVNLTRLMVIYGDSADAYFGG